MKKPLYILAFSVLALCCSAQTNKKGNNSNTSGTKPATTPVTEKELTGFLLNKFSYSDRVEFHTIAEALNKPEEVTTLKLNKQGLTEIPSDISKFKNLIELDLSDNEIADFSGKLSSLTNLQVLNLSGNKLTTVPSDICALKNLRSLNLSSNKITSGSFSCLSSLERLFVNNNLLTALPSGITEMQSLKSLYLHSNQLTSLDDKLARMPNLEVLLVQFNKIQDEPDQFNHTSIVSYMFYPQNINNKYLYKYAGGGVASIQHPVSAEQSSENAGASIQGLFMGGSEKLEDLEYNIKSVDAGNGYRRVKVGSHDYRRYSKIRLYVIMPAGILFWTPLHWVVSRKHRNNVRLSRVHYKQEKVEKIIVKESTVRSRQKAIVLNRKIVKIYKRYLKSNGVIAN